MDISLEVIMKFIASNPPSILFLGAILLALVGNKEFAYDLLAAEIFLQILWLVVIFMRKDFNGRAANN
jgi:hypothetical protein